MCNIFAPNLLHRKLSQLPTQRSHPQGNGGQMHLMAFSRFLHFPRMNLNPAAVPAVHIFSAALTRFPVHASLFSPLFMFTFVHVHLYFSLSVSPSPMHMHKPLMALLQSVLRSVDTESWRTAERPWGLQLLYLTDIQTTTKTITKLKHKVSNTYPCK